MNELLTALENATDSGRREIAKQVVDGLIAQDQDVADQLGQLCATLIENQSRDTPEVYERERRRKLSPGEFRPEEAQRLLTDAVRLGGFLGAIDRIPRWAKSNESIGIDAGCGPVPILAIGGAILHGHVVAYEINPSSHRIAEEAVKLFGLQDRIEVVQADVLDPKTELPGDAWYAVSETFGPGLLAREPGPQIIRRLAGLGIGHVLPWSARWRALDLKRYTNHLPEGRPMGSMVFATDELTVSGSFPSSDDGGLMVFVGVDYYDRNGHVVVGGNNNGLSYPGMIGAVSRARKGDIIQFRYPAGGDFEDVSLKVVPPDA